LTTKEVVFLYYGIVFKYLSSINSVGPFIRDRGTLDLAWLGDSDLDEVLGITSINATVLEFDFMPLTNFISFNYIFASNEYQDKFPAYILMDLHFNKEKGSTDSYKKFSGNSRTGLQPRLINKHTSVINFTPTMSSYILSCNK
jgi:hypothetical protein